MAIPNRLAILNDDGTTDASFALTYGLNAAGRAVQVDKDGQIIVGGDFSQIDDDVRNFLAAVAQDGAISTNVANANGIVRALIGQTDGKTLVAGAFTAIGGVNRGSLARVDASLNVEEAYAPTFNGSVIALAQQEDGKTLAGGSFATVSGVARANIARLYNNDAPTTLTVENVDLIQWLRGGASQEVQNVSFEEPIGTPIPGVTTRINGGWQHVPTSSLTGSGTITARAYPTDSHSEGILEDTVAYNVAPEIQVSVDGAILVDAVSTVDYADTQVGSTLSKVFTISNLGLSVLTLNATPATLSSTNADQWDIVAQPSSPINPGESVTFSLNFAPDATGSKVAILTITSDDSDEGTFTIGLTGDAVPGPGGLDATWQPVVNNVTYAAAISRMEQIWLGGAFTSINSLGRGKYARLNLGGVVQSQTGAGAGGGFAGGPVQCVCQLPNGQCLIAGLFNTVNGVTRPLIALLNADGSLDASFNMNAPSASASSYITALILEATGNVIVVGVFSSFGGINPSNRVVRINMTTKTVDTGFVVTTTGMRGGYAQTDGKIVLFGTESPSHIMRFNTDGSIDATFSAAVVGGTGVDMAIPTRAGKVVIAGFYSTIGGAAHVGVNRLEATGAYDATFTQISTFSQAMQMQCDGRVMIGATASGPLAATERLTRALTDGTNDSTFVATARNSVYGLALQEDGKLIVVGQFTLSGSATKYASRVINDANGASSSLSVVSPTQVQWLRTGTAPEAQIVRFAFSQDGGTTWTDIGQGVRVANGWELTGIALPQSGILRGQAYVQCGLYNGSVTIHEDQVPFSGLAVGDLNVEYPVGTTIADNGTLDFAGTLPGQFLDYTITLRNTGSANLTGISASIATSDWSITSAPLATLAPNQTTTATIRFAPSAVGVRPTTQLLIASSVAGAKNPYTILLSGNGVAVPTATTTNSTSPGSGERTFNGSFRANHNTANAYFQYKLASSGVWIDTTPPTVISGFVNVTASKTVTGLTVGQSYNWRAIVYNAVNAGQAPAAPFTGSIGTFTAT